MQAQSAVLECILTLLYLPSSKTRASQCMLVDAEHAGTTGSAGKHFHGKNR